MREDKTEPGESSGIICVFLVFSAEWSSAWNSPRDTDPLSSSAGNMANSSFQIPDKVSRLMSRQNGRPVLRPNRPLSLRDAVANRRPHKGEATCITEMSVMMACWKQNNFVEDLCSNEIQAFYSCVHKAQAALTNKSDLTGLEAGRLLPKQATTLLKRYPNLRTEI